MRAAEMHILASVFVPVCLLVCVSKCVGSSELKCKLADVCVCVCVEVTAMRITV